LSKERGHGVSGTALTTLFRKKEGRELNPKKKKKQNVLLD